MLGLAKTGVAVAVRDVLRGAALKLNFTRNYLDPRITFSRASNATLTGPDGTIQYAPHNLLTHSEQFDNAAWAKTQGTVTANVAAAPDGTSTVDAFIEGSGAVNPSLAQSLTVTAGLVYVLSVSAKERAGSAKRYLTLLFPSAQFGSNVRATFDLAAGTFVTTNSPVAAGMTLQSDGSYRCHVAATCVTTGATTPNIRLAAVTPDTISGYTGDGTSGLNLWGAQLNVGTLQPYYPTTVKNLLGFTNEFDNAAWTKSNSFVQTNLLTYSQEFDNAAWLRGGLSSVTANAAVAPDGSPTADLFTVAVGDNGSYQSVAVSPSTTYMWSWYVRLGTLSASNFRFAVYNNTAANFIAADIVPGQTPSSTDWTRITYTFTTPAGCTSIRVYPFRWNAGSGTYFVWGAQLVQGATPGDYVPTYGTARAVMYAAPDGTLTADKLVEDTANTEHRFGSVSISWVGGGVYTATLYAKAGERSVLDLLFGTSTNWVGGETARVATFNLAAGTVVLSPSSPSVASITPVGGGWYRCRLTATAAAAPVASGVFVRINNGVTASYQGDGTSGIYIWGAQLSDSASLDPYVYNPGAAPAAAAYYGPRFDYDAATLAPRGLLIEEQRTNSIRNNTMVGAVAGTPGTLPTNWSYGQLATLSTQVVGAGTEDGVDYVDVRVFGTATTTALVYFEANSTVTAVNAQTWATSLYVKRIAGTEANASSFLTSLRMSSSAGTNLGFVPGTAFTLPSSSTPLASCRFSSTHTTNNASTAFVMPAFAFNAAGAIDITLRIGMPQLEQGALATSVIPTTTAQATRAADVAVMTGANFASWYRQDEGTLYAETQIYSTAARNSAGFDINDGTTSNRNIFRAFTTGGADQTVIRSGGATVATLANVSAPTTAVRKSAAAYKANDFAFTAGGAAPAIDSDGAVPAAVNQMMLGYAVGPAEFLNGHIRRLAYFPRRLSNAELQGLTA